MKSRRFIITLNALAVIGTVISAYLFLRHLMLHDVSVEGGMDFCSELFSLGCDEALKSDFASFLGLPLAGWGIVYYLTILITSLTGEFLREIFRDTAENLIVIISGTAGIISFLFIVAFILSLIPFCPLCLLIHIINLLLLFVVLRYTLRSLKEILYSAFSGMKEFFFTKGPVPRNSRELIIPLLLIFVCGLLFYQLLYIQIVRLEIKEDYSFDEMEFLDDYESEKVIDLRISPDDPVIGHPGALVKMVIFSDFQCSGCRSVSQSLITLLNRFKTELNITFKNYPLSNKCNSSLTTDFHPYACQAAYAAEAAHMQGKFWQYHDLLFSTSLDGDEEELIEFAEELELNINKFKDDMKTFAVSRVAEDVDLGNEIGIKGTPTIFINGKRLNRPSIRSITWLIETLHGQLKNRRSR